MCCFSRRVLSSVAVIFLLAIPRTSAGAVFLFDATKAEMAGNADWVFDADLHDLKVSAASDGSGTPGAGNESDPQRFPTPPASGITASTPETYWQGGLSAWAVDLVKQGHSVESLPYNGHITYKNPANAQDLTNYNVFVLVEPNILFTSAEKAAIVNFVKDGGGLYIVSDHAVSDRNNDGKDSVQVLNDLMTNSVANNPFGFSFNSDNISGNSSNLDTSAADPLTHGPAGTAVNFAYNNGATLTINTNLNPSARIAMWSTATHGTNNAMMVYATYGAGKVVAAGDSSPYDDGTGDPNDTLFVNQGYADPSTSAGILILNGALWLATPLGQAPQISVQPSSQTLPAGQNATFTVTVAGSAPLTNQWRFNGTNIAGATATSYTRTNVQFADQGNYSVAVSNSLGSALSSNAVLAVQFPPVGLSFVSATNGQFQFVVVGAAGSNYAVQAATNLTGPAWVFLQTNSSPFTFTESNLAIFPERFYRVMLIP